MNPYQLDDNKVYYAKSKYGHNVLYINSDMLAVKPMDVFGKYDKFTLFWKTDPAQTVDFPVQFNGGQVYVPSTLPQEIWDFGFEKYKELLSQNPVPWATDQTVFNHMLYKQGFPPEEYMDNTMHYLDKTPAANVISKSEAKMLHYYGTRGRREAYENMQKDWRELHG